MSRIGRLPINVPSGVTVTIADDNTVSVKGPKGTLSQKIHKDIQVKQEGNEIIVSRPSDSKPHRSMHGLYRTLVNNMVVGVTQGFEKVLVMEGVGYRAQALHTLSSPSRVSEPDDELKDARRLLDLGQLSAARQALMRVACRSAEWNYLFGAVLLRLGESQKALLYFGVASRQKPDNSCYRAAYRSAEAICQQKKGGGRLRKLFPWK